MALKCQKMPKKLQKTHVRVTLLILVLKCFLDTHNFLHWYEILTTQTKLVCATFPKENIGNRQCMMKKQVVKVHYNPKMSRFRIFELLPNIQNNLDWHEIFITITTLQGDFNSTIFLKTNIRWRRYKPPQLKPSKCNLVNSNWTCELQMTFQKINTFWIDMKFNNTTRRSAYFPTSFIKFEHEMQKLQHFKSNLQTMWGNFWFPWLLRGNSKYSLKKEYSLLELSIIVCILNIVVHKVEAHSHNSCIINQNQTLLF